MSRMMLRSNGKPPLARSPVRLRPRPNTLQPTNSNTIHHTTPGSVTKSQLPNPIRDIEKSDFHPEYHAISCELMALAKMVHQELGHKDDTTMTDASVLTGPRKIPLFERGRLYDEYSARRNERLTRKKGETKYEKKPSYDLGVRVESAKKREPGRFNGRKKAAMEASTMTPVGERREAQTPRYSLRSCTNKENKKPPVPVRVPFMSVERSVGVSERKMGVRMTRKT
ncbi:hypothetical protein OROGR_033023 [Orobanche gracilis]